MKNKIGQSPPVKIRLAEVAKKSGVSISTVSMALSDSSQINKKTKKLILRVSDKLGYRPPRLRTARNTFDSRNSKTVRFGLMVCGSNIEDEANYTLLHKLSEQSLLSGVRMEFASIEDISNPAEVMDRTLGYASELDGLLLMGMVNYELLIKLQEIKSACLIIGTFMTDIFQSSNLKHLVSSVKVNPVEGGQLATASLINRGHQKTGFVCEYLCKGLWYDQFLMGFKLAHLNANIPFCEELVHVDGKPYAGGAMAAEAFSKLADPPTAFVIPDARTAASFIQEYRTRGGNIDKYNTMVSGHQNLVKKYNLNDYPFIAHNTEQLAAISIYYLKCLVDQPQLGAMEINVPWTIKNLPAPILPQERI